MRAIEQSIEGVATRVLVRPLRQEELAAADRIMRLAFGTFLGLPDPLSFMGDAGYIRTRWAADRNVASLAAEIDGDLAGSNFVTRWGSVGFFGPLTIQPDLWNSGIAKRLLEATMECFVSWGVTHAGLFTFGHSAKHLGLYQRFGFWPRFLTAIVSKPVSVPHNEVRWQCYSELTPGERHEALASCRDLAGAIYEGLDLSDEMDAIDTQRLGDTVLIHDERGVAGFATCHCGPGTEAGSGTCYVKFGAARPGTSAREHFERLLDACEGFALERGQSRLVVGASAAREGAYRAIMVRGFRADLVGVAMHLHNQPGYHRPDVFAIDDWR